MADILVTSFSPTGAVLSTTGKITETPEQENLRVMRENLASMIATFGANYRGWASMTTAQKDAANRNAQRAIAQLARFALYRLEAAD